MKNSLFIVAGIMIFISMAIAENNAASDTIKVFTDLEESFETGKPVVCLFYTQKSCKCTNDRCKKAMDFMVEIKDKLPENITYCEIETASNAEIVKKYRLVSPPVLLFFDSEGKQITRLDAWKIDWKNIETELEKLQKEDDK